MDAATRTPTRPDWPTRTFAPLYHRLLDRIDRGLAEGAIEAYLPDGTRRLLGGHAAGPLAVVRVVRWRALRRLATAGSICPSSSISSLRLSPSRSSPARRRSSSESTIATITGSSICRS